MARRGPSTVLTIGIALAVAGALGFAIAKLRMPAPAELVTTPIPVDAAPVARSSTPAHEPELAPTDRKVLRVEIALAAFDPTLHALRIEWAGDSASRGWAWPSWMTHEQLLESIETLRNLAAEAPAIPKLDAAIRTYSDEITLDAEAMHGYVKAWATLERDPVSPKRPLTIVDLMPAFEHLGRTSKALRTVIASVRVTRTEPTGSISALQRVTLDAASTLASQPGSYRPAEWVDPTVFVATPERELRDKASACIRAVSEYLDRSGHDTYIADMAVSLGMSLHKEIDGIARGESYVSWASNVAQNMTYLARKWQ